MALDLKIPKNREFVGGDLVAQTLAHMGFDVAFGLHGGHLDAFLVGATEAGIRLVDTRHETVAVQAAEGYSKVKRQCGLCFFTANSGFGNALPGLSTAFADRSSVLCITSSSPQRDVDMNVLQGFHDQVVVSKPVTKWTQRVPSPEEIPRLVAYGLRQATSAPAGPVLLDCPIEVLFSPVRRDKIAWGSSLSLSRLPFPPGPHPDAIKEAAALLAVSERPVVVTSTGARSLRGDPAWEAFLAATHIPVFHSTKYSAPLSRDHPQRAGNAGLLPVLGAIGQAPPDLVILAGCRTGMFLGSRGSPALPSHDVCKYIQIDTDGGEIGRGWHIDVGITSDVRSAIAALVGAMSSATSNRPSRAEYPASPDWVKAALSLKTLPSPHETEPELGPNGRLHPFHATKAVLSALPPGAILSIDGGECGSWAAQLSEAHARASEVFFSCGYLGFLGNGWGYSLGAAVATGGGDGTTSDRPLVVNWQGDGSAGFHLTELDTFARHGCRVLTVVMNNHCWGMSDAGQHLVYGSGSGSDRHDNPSEFKSPYPNPVSALSAQMDFAAVARGLGCDAAEKVDGGSVQDVRDAVERALKTMDASSAPGKPALLEVLVDSRPVHPGTVAMVGKTEDPDVVVIPYYDNVDRARYKE